MAYKVLEYDNNINKRRAIYDIVRWEDVLRNGDIQIVEIYTIPISAELDAGNLGAVKIKANAYTVYGWFQIDLNKFNKRHTVIEQCRFSAVARVSNAGKIGYIRLRDITNNADIATLSFNSTSYTYSTTTNVTLPSSGIIQVEVQAYVTGHDFFVRVGPVLELYKVSKGVPL